jgi:glycosyltransferase involved in cell wall biosynthesis
MSSISVVIPCYNQAHFLDEALASVRTQTLPADEVIVVDDGSTDDVAAVVARFPGVRCVRQSNQGLSAARNRGLRESTGDLLVFLDSDDRLLPHALEVGTQHLDENPPFAMTFGYCTLIDSDGAPLPTPPPAFEDGDPYRALLVCNYIWMTGMVMCRRVVFESIAGFDPSVNPASDYDLYLRVSREFPICCNRTVVAEYRQHGSNMSRNPALMLQTVLTVLKAQREYAARNKEYWKAYSTGVRAWKEFYGDELVNEMRAHVRASGRWGQTLTNIAVLFRLYPGGLIKHALRKLYVSSVRLWKDA